MESLNTFLEYGNPALVNRNLRTVLFEYLEDELRIGTTTCFMELLPQLNYLFNFLEEAAQTKANTVDRKIGKYPALTVENCAESLLKNDLLYWVINFIVATLQPERIYSITHQSLQQEQPITDLLIVLPDIRQEKPFSDYETLIEAGCIGAAQVQFSLHQASHLNASLMEGHVFYSVICVPQQLIYWNRKKTWPQTETGKLNSIKNKAFADFQRAFNRAEVFLTHARLSTLQNESLAAFFLQQAAELCCRAVISSLMGLEKKTHSIALLKKYCQRCTPVVNEIFPGNSEEEKRILKLLDDAYLSARYDDSFSPYQNDLEVLLEKVTELHMAAHAAVKHRLHVQ